jgi:hypothetical protein
VIGSKYCGHFCATGLPFAHEVDAACAPDLACRRRSVPLPLSIAMSISPRVLVICATS